MDIDKKHIYFSCIFLLGLSILILVMWLDIKVKGLLIRNDPNATLLMSFISLLFIIFGMLIECNRVTKAFKDGIKVDRLLLVLSTILIIMVLIPRDFIVVLFGLPAFFNIKSIIAGLMTTGTINAGLSMLAGITFIRALKRN